MGCEDNAHNTVDVRRIASRPSGALGAPPGPNPTRLFFFPPLKLAPPDEELEVILVWRFHKGSGPGGVEAGLRRCPTLTAQLSGCGERRMKGRSVHGI